MAVLKIWYIKPGSFLSALHCYGLRLWICCATINNILATW